MMSISYTFFGVDLLNRAKIAFNKSLKPGGWGELEAYSNIQDGKLWKIEKFFSAACLSPKANKVEKGGKQQQKLTLVNVNDVRMLH
jgi:hypothetical protein